jgi:hypothetical protein
LIFQFQWVGFSPKTRSHQEGQDMWQLRNDEAVRVEAAVKQVLPPCQIKCPIKEAIQRTNVLVSLLPKDPAKAKEGIIQIGDYLYERNPFFTVCGYICGICDQAYRYRRPRGGARYQLLFPLVRVNFELGVIMVIAVSCVKLLSAHNSTQHTSRKA